MQSLDSISLLTQGDPLSVRNLIRQSAPAINRCGFAWEENGSLAYAAQATHRANEIAARLSFIAAAPAFENAPVTALLEQIIKTSGKWQVRWLLGELPSDSNYFPAFRQADFKVWATQKHFRFEAKSVKASTAAYSWRTWTGGDVRATTCLHRNSVPKLFQHLEPLTLGSMLGLVLFDARGSLLGYADLVYGPRGAWVRPLLAPEAQDPAILVDMLASLPYLSGRPVYVCARSYQPRLEALLTQLGGGEGPEEALLVRYLVIRDKVAQTQTSAVFEASSAETSLPVAQVQKKDPHGT